eukprot:221971_1
MSRRVGKIVQHLEQSNKTLNGTVNGTHSMTQKQIKQSMDLLVGTELGISSWFAINQTDVDLFHKASLSPNYNYIHFKDAGKKGSPFGKPIVQGAFVLSLIDHMVTEVATKKFKKYNSVAGINYGYNKIRFIAPVFVGSKLRGIIKLKSVQYGNKHNSLRFVYDITIEAQNKDTSKMSNVCIAEFVSMVVYSL